MLASQETFLRGFKVGEMLHFCGSSLTLGSGYKLPRGQQGKLEGLQMGDEEMTFLMLFPENKRITLSFEQLSRESPAAA